MSISGGGFLALTAVLLCGCLPIVGPAQEAPLGPVGPELVIEVENRQARDAAIGYEYEAVASAGSGEGLVPACSRTDMGFGEIAGAYRILADGVSVFDGTLPAGTPQDGFFVVRVVIDADGTPDLAAPPRWTRIPPDRNDILFEDCG